MYGFYVIIILWGWLVMGLKRKIQISTALIVLCIALLINFIVIFAFTRNKSPTVNQTQNVNVMSSTKEKVNLNTASLEGLKSLPSIGDKLAQKIINNRPYTTVYDLKNIKGIGDKIVKNIEGDVVCE